MEVGRPGRAWRAEQLVPILCHGEELGGIPPCKRLKSPVLKVIFLPESDPSSLVVRKHEICCHCDGQYNDAGKGCLVERGGCMFIEKVRRAQAAGAVGVLVVNTKGESDDKEG